jgi:hypothetical protein
MHGVRDRLRVIAPLTRKVASPDEGLDFAVADLDRHAAEVAPAPGARARQADGRTRYGFLGRDRYIRYAPSPRSWPSANSHASTRPGSLGLRRQVCRAPVHVRMMAVSSDRSTRRLPEINQHKPC